MPIYQYRCSACEHSVEAIQKMSDDPLQDCPQCNEPALRKQVTAARFKLKGTGWYETDFKNGSKNQPANSNAKSTEAKSTEPKSSETKSAEAKS